MGVGAGGVLVGSSREGPASVVGPQQVPDRLDVGDAGDRIAAVDSGTAGPSGVGAGRPGTGTVDSGDGGTGQGAARQNGGRGGSRHDDGRQGGHGSGVVHATNTRPNTRHGAAKAVGEDIIATFGKKKVGKLIQQLRILSMLSSEEGMLEQFLDQYYTDDTTEG